MVREVAVGIFLSEAIESVEVSFFGLLRCKPQLSLFVLSWPVIILRLDTELFLLLELRYVVVDDLTEGLGLGMSLLFVLRLFIVTEAGNLGGGILSCFGGGGGWLDSLSPAAWEALILFFDPDRFQLRLNFLRNEFVEDGVGGSSGLDNSAAGVSLLANLLAFKARGPVNLAGLFSVEMSIVVKSPLVFDRGMRC